MKFFEQEIKGVYRIEPDRYGDSRGYFCEVFKKEEFRAHVGDVEFIQDNESVSSFGVLRGLHFQKNEFAQAKLVRVSSGCVLDVAVDLRSDSPTFGRHVAVELSGDNSRQLFIPRGFAHGFVVLSDTAQFQYKVDNVYAPQSECTLCYDDPELGIDWRLENDKFKLSDKDKVGIQLKDIK